MMRQVKDLQAGQIISIQYGDYDNWVKFTVDEVVTDHKRMTVRCHAGAVQTDFSWKPEEEVEVVNNG